MRVAEGLPLDGVDRVRFALAAALQVRVVAGTCGAAASPVKESLEHGPGLRVSSNTRADGRDVQARDLGAYVPASSREKNSSAVRVFVCCSPSRGTPRSIRKARDSATT